MKPATLDGWMAARAGLAEPLTRAAIADWQVERLRVAVAYAHAASPFYRARGEAPDIDDASPTSNAYPSRPPPI